MTYGRLTSEICCEMRIRISDLDVVQTHFKSASGQKTAEQEARQHAELMKSLPQGTKVDAAMLRVATDMQMVRSARSVQDPIRMIQVCDRSYIAKEGTQNRP